MARNFVVAPLDPDSNRRHFSSLNNACMFARSQAKQAWSSPVWTVKVVNDKGEDTDIRVNVSNNGTVLVLDHGVRIGAADNGYIAEDGKLRINSLAGAVLNQFTGKGK